MKALTLHQPYADMVARGHKSFETRSWKTNYRGGLAIHASRNWSFSHVCDTDPFRTLYGGAEVVCAPAFYGEMIHGGVVAVVNLLSCIPASEARKYLVDATNKAPSEILRQQAAYELLLGDYSDGRWAWELELLCQVEGFGLVRGYQGLWNLPVNIAAELQVMCEAQGITW